MRATGCGPRRVLIDWDTLLLAPPERDLWMLADGVTEPEPSVLEFYARATGLRPRTDLIDLYRIRWRLTDLAEFVRRFRELHSGSVEDEACRELLRSMLEQD